MADNVLGTLFGDIADAIRTKTGETAKMKPNEFPAKILAIQGGGSVSETDIFPEQDVAFSYFDAYGCYLSAYPTGTFTLVEGEEYKVLWGETVYPCTAFYIESMSATAIGNTAVIGGENNGLPFAVGSDATGGVTFFAFEETTTKVRIYQDVSNEKEVRYTSGRFTPTADKTIHTITHGLGVVPDLILVSIGHTIKETDMPNYYNTIYGGFAFSSAFLEKLPSDVRGAFGAWWTWIGGDFGFLNVGTGGLDEPESSTKKIFGIIRGANASTFMVGGTSNHMPKDMPYNWFALTGLL